MTFKETEFPEILKLLNDYAEKIYPVNLIVKEAYNLYQKVPIYIGIVGNCLANVIKETEFKDLKVSDIVIIKDKNTFYQGQIKKIKNGSLELKNVHEVKIKKNANLKVKKSKVLKLNFSTLQQLWPSLSFKK